MNVRVSTEEQRTDLQERQLKEYVERRGWVLHKLYRDKMSGVSTKRPGLDELLRDCRRRSIDVVVVWKFDRFAQSLKIPNRKAEFGLAKGGFARTPATS